MRRRSMISIALSAGILPATELIGLNLGAFHAHASPVAPEPVAKALRNAHVRGQYRLMVLGFNIYDARLWTSPNFDPERYASQDFALELNYLRNFSGQSIAERSLKEMRGLSELPLAQADAWLARMQQIFPDVKKGDQLMGLHSSAGRATFLHNGKEIGEVNDPEFSRLFFGIWLSPQTSQPKMRRQLLGLNAASGAGAAR